MKTPANQEEWEIALRNCAEERIQFIGHIQSGSVLLAMDLQADLFTYASGNAATIFGEGWSGMTPSALFGERQLTSLSRRVASWLGRGARLVEVSAGGHDSLPAWAYKSGTLLVVEVDVRELDDSRTPESWDWEDQLRASLNRVEACRDLRSKLEAVCEETWKLGGFDRVMIYRFLEDGTGEVVAERVRGDWEPYLGLRYPSSDIPAQARKLFEINEIRLIREVPAEPVEIISLAGEHPPLDLSLSRFRQPSAVHIEYLKNMGVSSSFVSAIVSDGVLWGLISSHHGEPLNLSAKRQMQLTGLTNHLATDIAGMAREVRLRNELACARITSKIIQCITVTDDWTAVLMTMAGELCEIMKADGLALQFDGNSYFYGIHPESAVLDRLIAESHSQSNGHHLAHARDPREPRFEWLPDEFGGFLALPLSHFRPDALVFFRKESSRQVTWAGKPEKVVDRTSGVPRLRPRESFAAWQETVRGTCDLWSAEELAVAGTIRTTLSDIVITAHYFRQSYEAPATTRHRLAHEMNPDPVALADENGIVVFHNQAAAGEPLLANLQSLDQIAPRLADQEEAFAGALHELVKAGAEIRFPLAGSRWLEASQLMEDGRLVGYSIRLG